MGYRTLDNYAACVGVLMYTLPAGTVCQVVMSCGTVSISGTVCISGTVSISGAVGNRTVSISGTLCISDTCVFPVQCDFWNYVVHLEIV